MNSPRPAVPLFAPLFDHLPRPRPATRIDWPKLPGGAQALALAGLAQGAGAPLVIVAARPMDAQRLLDELRWFAPALRTHQLPDWETLPYDQFSPHNDLVSERLETLYTLMRGELDVLVVPASTALYRLAPREYLAAHTFFVEQGEKLDVERLRLQLTVAGYSAVTQVVAPGEYSVRGGLVDLYPMSRRARRRHPAHRRRRLDPPGPACLQRRGTAR
jgi:transcription-repair coupling factor (superfamily II helicase)